MGWKKPRWVQKVQKAASNVVKIENKPPVLQKIQAVAQKAADATGDFFRPLGEVYKDREPRTKIEQKEPTRITDTVIQNKGLDPVDAQIAAGKSAAQANRDSFSQQTGRIDARSQPDTPMIKVASGGAAIRSLPELSPEAEDDTIPSGAYKGGKPVGPSRDKRPSEPTRDSSPKNSGATVPQYGLTEEKTPANREAMLQRLKNRYKR